MSEDINFGKISEALNNKADRDLNNTDPVADYVVESYSDENSNWYEVWKSGWLRQGGLAISDGTNSVQTVTFLKPFSKKPQLTGGTISSDTGYATNQGTAILHASDSLTTTGFSTYLAPAIKKYWTAEGQGAK